MMNCKNFIKSTLLDIGPKVYSERNFLLPAFLFFLWEQSWTLFLEFESRNTILNEEQGGNWVSHSCWNKSFQFFLISDLHQLADDANKIHNYIIIVILNNYLFFRQLIQQLFPLSQLFYWTKAKKFQINSLCNESKIEFSEELKLLRIGKIKRANSNNSYS